MAKAVVEEMRLSYSGRTSLHTQLPHLLEMLATVYNLLGQHKKQVETMKAMVDCVGDSVLKYYWAPYPHLYYAQALLHLMNNARAAKRVANEAFELVKIHSGVDKRLFLKKNPEFAEFIK
jgi:ribosomal protein L30/L7E